jgi:hypothetical protein
MVGEIYVDCRTYRRDASMADGSKGYINEKPRFVPGLLSFCSPAAALVMPKSDSILIRTRRPAIPSPVDKAFLHEVVRRASRLNVHHFTRIIAGLSRFLTWIQSWSEPLATSARRYRE